MKNLSRVPGLLLLLISCLGCGDDGGWTVDELGTDAVFGDVYFLDSVHGWIVGGSYPVEGGIVGKTDDGGRTWLFRSDLVRVRARPESVRLHAVHFLDRQRGFIATSGGDVLRTVDGGEHWHPVYRGSRRLLDLEFVDSEYGWAAGGSTLIRTTDGGQTWRSPILPDTRQHFSARAIRFLSRDLGWSVGSAGGILRTVDGGESWTQLAEPVSGGPDLRALSFVDANRGWVVGDRGTILHTENGGLAWAKQEIGGVWSLTGVLFIDTSTGWVVGFDRGSSRSAVLRTEDGGNTWSEHLLVEGQALFTLAFSASGHGWAAGERVRPHPQRLLRYEPSH